MFYGKIIWEKHLVRPDIYFFKGVMCATARPSYSNNTSVADTLWISKLLGLILYCKLPVFCTFTHIVTTLLRAKNMTKSYQTLAQVWSHWTAHWRSPCWTYNSFHTWSYGIFWNFYNADQVTRINYQNVSISFFSLFAYNGQ